MFFFGIYAKKGRRGDKYNMAYINYVDMKRVPGDFKRADLLELLRFFRTKGTS